MNLKDKVVIITGGAQGLGRAMAEILMEKGAHIVVCDVNIFENSMTGVMTLKADVTKEEDLQSVTAQVLEKFGTIDIWINNAGIWLPREPLEQVNLEKANKLFQVNVFGTINGIRAALKIMRPKNAGVIMNIISTTAFDGMNGSSGSIYVSSKYALRGLTNSMRDELKDSDIQIIGVYPGGIKTNIFHEQPPQNINEFMSAENVAQKIIENLELDKPEIELILKRPGQVMTPIR